MANWVSLPHSVSQDYTLLSAGLQSSQGSTGGGSASKLPQVDVTGLKDHFQGHAHGLSTGRPHGTAAGFPQSMQSRRKSERQFPEWKPQSFSTMCLEWHRITSAIFYSIWSMCHIPLKDVALKPPHRSKAFDKLCLQNYLLSKIKPKNKTLAGENLAIRQTRPLHLWNYIHKVVGKPFSDVLTLPCPTPPWEAMKTLWQKQNKNQKEKSSNFIVPYLLDKAFWVSEI